MKVAETFNDPFDAAQTSNIQNVIEQTVFPFTNPNSRQEQYFVFSLKDGNYRQVAAQRYQNEKGNLKLHFPRSGLTNKNAAQIIAQTLNSLPLRGNPDRYRYQVYSGRNGEFVVEKGTETLPPLTQAPEPGTEAANGFTFIDLEPSAPSIPVKTDLEIIAQTPSDLSKNSLNKAETNPQIPIDPEYERVSFDAALERIREIGMPANPEEVQEFQMHLDDAVTPYTSPETTRETRVLGSIDGINDLTLTLPVSAITNREAAEIVKEALNQLRPDQGPGAPAYYTSENENGTYSLNIRVNGFAPSFETDIFTEIDPENFPQTDEEDLDDPFRLK